MAMIHDFSDIDMAVFQRSLFLITDNVFIEYDELKNEISLVNDYMSLAKEELKDKKYPFMVFWLGFSLGIEYLAKAVLIKNKINIFSKKNLKSSHQQTRISASNNPWLSSIFSQYNIKFVAELSTGTIGDVIHTHLSRLNIAIKEIEFLKESLTQLKDERRNNDLHFYFKENNFISNKDLPNVYIPLVNKLLELFYK